MIGASLGAIMVVAGLGAAAPALAVPAWTSLDDYSVLPPAKSRETRKPDPRPVFVMWHDHLSPPLSAGEGTDSSLAEKFADLADIKPRPGLVIEAIDADGLAKKFDTVGYRLTAVRKGDVYVPRMFVDEMPRDMRKVQSADLRKRLFIRTMLPLILRANEEVRRERRRLLAIAAQIEDGVLLHRADALFLRRMKTEYADADVDLTELLRRVDVVPPSLALAQAAEESGWGTSRFVREGNAVFGQRTFRGTGGLVPLRRGRNESHLVRSFSHVQASVAAYVFNLNTHPAYGDFRKLRARARATGKDLDSRKLVGTLKRYSERGDAYIKTIRAIMRVNDLSQFDKARLSPHGQPLPPREDDMQSMQWSF